MDTLAAPAKKKLTITRASEDQIDILKNGFAASQVSSGAHLKALSEATGLSRKWVSSWFMRERKKIRRESDGMTNSDPPMSTTEILDFKTEYRDPALADEATADNNSDSPVSQPKSTSVGKKGPGRPRKTKVKAERRDVEEALKKAKSKSPKPVSLVPRAPPRLLPAVVPFSSSSSSQVGDKTGMSSNLNILRPIVPRMYKPPETPFTASAALSSTSRNSASATTDTNYPALIYHYSNLSGPASETDVSNNNLQCPSQADLSSGANTTIPVQASPATRIPLQPVAHFSPNGHPITSFPIEPQLSAQAVPYSQLCPREDPSSGQPVYSTAPATMNYQTAVQHSFPTMYPLTPAQKLAVNSRITKENRAPVSHPSNLFTTTPLAWPVPSLNTSEFGSQFEQLLNFHRPLDPTATPLKHLTVLCPYETQDTDDGIHAILNAEQVMGQLLDENLAMEDPFQAAMGLSFLSRLGLDWDYSDS